MELCPKCGRMTAEKNHYNGKVICYNKFCVTDAAKKRNAAAKNTKKIFFISPVMTATPENTKACEKYVAKMEKRGHKIFWPIRDNPHQKTDPIGIKICDINLEELLEADEVHIWYLKESSGIHFDIGATYMLIKILHYQKKVIFVNRNEFIGDIDMCQNEHKGKSFMRVLDFLDKNM